MTLKTFEEIKNYNSAEFTEYASYLLSLGWNSADLHIIGSNLSIPIEPFMADYVLSSYLEGVISDLRFVGSNLDFCTEHYKVLTWGSEGFGIFITLEDAAKVVSILAIYDITGEVEFGNREYLRNSRQEEYTRCETALRRLQLVSGEEAPRVVPAIPESLFVEESTERFSSAIWFNKIQEKEIILAGLGGIGSYVAFLLSRMRPKQLCLYDDDVVEEVNMAGQLFAQEDIDRHKVDAAAERARSFANYYSVMALKEKYTEGSMTSDIMICGFDNMEARKTFFKKWVEHVINKPEDQRHNCLFIDGRLAAEEFQVLCIRGDDSYNMGRYKNEFLFDDNEADETLCSYKQTTYMANMIASIMVNLFTNFAANQVVDNLRDLPFFTSYSADSMMFKAVY